MTSFKHLNIAAFEQMQQKQSTLQIVDIRDHTSFNSSHIPGAIHLSNDNLADFITQADLDEPLVVVCYHGNSSQQAAQYLHEQGFEQVYSLDGGFEKWSQLHL